jgi:flagellar hook assembly protein FlgD
MDLDLREVPANLVSVTLKVYDVRGRLVRTAFEGTLQNELYTGYLQWDGNDAVGEPVASGIYFLQLQAGTHTVSKKVVILR